jgi:predicted alpha/beta-fold hydrolase
LLNNNYNENEYTNTIFSNRFTNSISEIPSFVDVKGVMNAESVRDFDAAVTAPQFGYPNVVAYYKDASTKGHVHKFPIPVFALNAEDDPMSPGECELMSLPST